MTNRERFAALRAGWDVVGGGVEPLISFATFVAGVEAYERHLSEHHLDAQYRYEQAREREIREAETPLGLSLDGYSEEVC